MSFPADGKPDKIPDTMPDIGLDCMVRAAANHGPRIGDGPGGGPVDMLVLHYTGMVSEGDALERLCAADSGVSCHYLVLEDGTIVQMVAEARRAWHAGKSVWRGVTDINSRSIGIEIANPGHEYGYRPFPEPQMAAVVSLCRDIVARNAIAARNVLAHSDIAPTRKQDPGEKFDWKRLHEAGVGHWVKPAPLGEPDNGESVLRQGDKGGAVAELQRMLASYGYGIRESGVFEEMTTAVVTAFQRHFRPARVDGIADCSTVVTLERLLAALPAEESSG